jgi:hypothetical protein
LLRNLRFHLYRRVVEIWDGRLALRPYYDARVPEFTRARSLAAGLNEQQAAPVIEAASLAAALQVKARGLAVGELAPPPAP